MAVRRSKALGDVPDFALLQLTGLLRMEPTVYFGDMSTKWLAAQEACLQYLEPTLLRPKELLPRVAIRIGKHPVIPFCPSRAVLCSSHKALDPRVIRNMMILVANECTVHAEGFRKLRLKDQLSPELLQWLARLDFLTALWLGARNWQSVFGHYPEMPIPYCVTTTKCEACILAVIGGSPLFLMDLRISLLSRQKWAERAKVAMEHQSRLFRVLDSWFSLYEDPEIHARVSYWSEVLADEIAEVRVLVRQMEQEEKEKGPDDEVRTVKVTTPAGLPHLQRLELRTKKGSSSLRHGSEGTLRSSTTVVPEEWRMGKDSPPADLSVYIPQKHEKDSVKASVARVEVSQDPRKQYEGQEGEEVVDPNEPGEREVPLEEYERFWRGEFGPDDSLEIIGTARTDDVTSLKSADIDNLQDMGLRSPSYTSHVSSSSDDDDDDDDGDDEGYDDSDENDEYDGDDDDDVDDNEEDEKKDNEAYGAADSQHDNMHPQAVNSLMRAVDSMLDGIDSSRMADIPIALDPSHSNLLPEQLRKPPAAASHDVRPSSSMYSEQPGFSASSETQAEASRPGQQPPTYSVASPYSARNGIYDTVSVLSAYCHAEIFPMPKHLPKRSTKQVDVATLNKLEGRPPSAASTAGPYIRYKKREPRRREPRKQESQKQESGRRESGRRESKRQDSKRRGATSTRATEGERTSGHRRREHEDRESRHHQEEEPRHRESRHRGGASPASQWESRLWHRNKDEPEQRRRTDSRRQSTASTASEWESRVWHRKKREPEQTRRKESEQRRTESRRQSTSLTASEWESRVWHHKKKEPEQARRKESGVKELEQVRKKESRHRTPAGSTTTTTEMEDDARFKARESGQSRRRDDRRRRD